MKLFFKCEYFKKATSEGVHLALRVPSQGGRPKVLYDLIVEQFWVHIWNRRFKMAKVVNFGSALRMEWNMIIWYQS